MFKPRILSHTLIMVLVVCASYILSRWLGTTYDLEITALFFVMYLILKRFYPRKPFDAGISSHQVLDATAFTFIILNIVISTGGLSSPFFFLIYFHIFALALILEPITSLTTVITLVVLFATELVGNSLPLTPSALVPLISLPFIVPFALFIGSEHRKVKKQQRRISSLKARESNVEKDALMFISTIVRGHLRTLDELSNNFHGDHELRSMQKTIRRMNKLIDSFEDEY